jgi:transketolase
VEPCKRCGGITRHRKVVSKPAFVGQKQKFGAAKSMSDMKKPRDKNWKERVKKGLNPEGQPLTNLRRQHREEWKGMQEQQIPHYQEQKKELQDRVKKGEKLSIFQQEPR